MSRAWIVYLKWQLGREEWRIIYFDLDVNILEALYRVHYDLENSDAVLPILVQIVGPVE